tara:strand:+ start:214 stop:378 length:165 start_codon:yes stop_codon:yes gene_type:complete
MKSKDLCSCCLKKLDNMNKSHEDIHIRGVFTMIERIEQDLNILKSKLRDRSLKL